MRRLDAAPRSPLPVIALCLLAGLTLEGIAAYYLLLTPELLWWRSLPQHLMASLLLAIGLWQGLPRGISHPATGTLAFLLASLIMLPGIGALGIVLGVLPALHGARRTRPAAWRPLPLPDLPFRAVPLLAANDPALRDGLGSVLSGAGAPQQRQQAILACRHLPRRQAVPLLRQGLMDAADDVRLLAYSMLNAIERELDSRLLALTRTIEHGDDPTGRRAEAISTLYWEYAYLGLAQGSTLRYLLEQALAFIDQALDHQATAQRWLQRGRLCAMLGDVAGAERAFAHCEHLGMDDDDLAPRRAELAFQQRRFPEVRRQLARLSAAAAGDPTLHPVASFWHPDAAPRGDTAATAAWDRTETWR
ncbi:MULTISPECIES: HEAT repeat domain-containing protein [Halomonas]|uniref:Pellicle/biofilm biosynthesis protein PelE n=1 Tax=Halomonas halophila TaxID=29573 RepID=A0ABQ0U4S3_9GAMM|nr:MULTISPECIES: HEAT repeat domain-containing protein [Halomonas]MDR5889105.1 hypothetical protein [Halomonas salina]WJY07337.1 hypothetical protein QWG60_00100 [Halomonas halophila]GEK73161.1 pellicle/biofilm biosynthesis protein PelE [Halomonas halophila]